jgi:hypothetical protein
MIVGAFVILGVVCLLSVYINVALLNRLLVQAALPSLRPVPARATIDPKDTPAPKRPVFSIPVHD